MESSLTYRTSGGQSVQNLELRINDLGNVEWRRLTRYENAQPSFTAGYRAF
ncbi:MAG: hypothetical protein NTV80_05520 [Verrucomicrobia bacterium]|nr:hypothetical protein [Verrucomicrobiota bacterium]